VGGVASAPAAIFARNPFGNPVWIELPRSHTNTWFMFTSQENEAPTMPPTTWVPVPDLGSTTALILVLLAMLFLADAVKQVVVPWQYRR
jgi:hypothetical protein